MGWWSFFSSDTGSSWNSLNNGLTNQHVRKLIYGINYLFAGTEAGVYQFDLSLHTSQEVAGQHSLNIYPNPCGSAFKIKFEEDFSLINQEAAIHIFNTYGEKVAVKKIILEKEARIEIGKELSPGYYNFKIQIQNQSFSGKFLVE